MRLRNIPNASEIIKKSSYILEEYSQYKGHFKDIFQNSNPIYLEIGMGKGNFIIENAIQNPDINYIGIEKYASVLVKALEKLETKKLDNLKILNIDAINIDEIFNHEIALIYLNFSDPWPKKRHAKRRLTSKSFLEKYDKIFYLDKHIIMKTDNRKLFEFSLKEFTDYNYKIENISLDLHKDEFPNNIKTEYEDKFQKLGYPIYMVDVRHSVDKKTIK